MNIWADRARDLRGDIVAAQAAMDQDRRMPDGLAAQLAEAGFFKLCVPKAFGGGQLDPSMLTQTLEVLAEADASAAWVAMIGATVGARAAYLDPAAADDIFGDPKSIVTGVYAPMGKAHVENGAYRASGRWKWNSGGQNSHWIAGGCVLMENGAPVKDENGAPLMRMIFAPREKIRFIDTWHTGGLRGSGSGDMAMDAIEAPFAHSASLIYDRPRVAGALYVFPAFGLLALGIASVASGNARAALDDFAAAAKGKKMPNGRMFAERGTTHLLFAQAHAEYAAARAFLFSEIESAWGEAQRDAAISLAQRARLRLACTHVTRTAAEIVRRLQDHAGGASVFLDDPLQRRLRDAQTMTAHIMTAPGTYELTGRVLLGGEGIAEL